MVCQSGLACNVHVFTDGSAFDNGMSGWAFAMIIELDGVFSFAGWAAGPVCPHRGIDAIHDSQWDRLQVSSDRRAFQQPWHHCRLMREQHSKLIDFNPESDYGGDL